MTAAGIIFSNIHDANLPELTRNRTIASVPFGCRYRLIDFTLSNMVNSNISNISVITRHNYQSLMDHIGSGKDWDLARRNGGIKIYPPFINAYANQDSNTKNSRMEALKSIHHVFSQMREEYVVLSDCDVICNVDLSDMIRSHAEHNADITVAVKKMKLSAERAANSVLFDLNGDGRITDVRAYSPAYAGEGYVNLNIMVMSRAYLEEMVQDAIAHGYTSITRDVLSRYVAMRNFRAYEFDGYFACISSFEDYFACNMDLVENPDIRAQLFGVAYRPVYTKVRNSPPTYYSETSVVKNSLIADGCEILGTVENSILFRGVKIGKNTVVRNCILFQDTFTGEDVHLDCVIADKNALIRDHRTLAGVPELPFYISKNKKI